MSARIDIVNIALSMVGADSITSIEDDAPEAQLMKTNYYIARDATLEAYEWSFAIKRFIPAREEDAPTWGWAYAYPLPSDILRVLRVDRDYPSQSLNRDRMYRNQVPFEVEQRKILTSESSIYCTGIRRIEDEGIYSNLFCHAFSAKLAMLTCYAITESNQKFKAMAAIYDGAIKEAKSRDGQQGTTRRMRSHWLRRARGG